MDETVELLRRLSEAFGVAGFEDEVREIVLQAVRPLADELRTDALGNLLVTRRGRRPDVLLLDAHLDEVGFLVSFVEPDGFLRLAPLGSWDPRVLPAQAVTIRTRDGASVRGVVGTVPPHVQRDEDRGRPVRLEELWVDVGASSAAAVEALGIRVGDPCVPAYPFERIGEDLVMGKAFDDRAGCTVAVRVLEELASEELELTVVAAFTVGEEVGLRGARTAAYQVRPAVALALEGTTAADVPSVPPPRQPCALGRGPAITVADHSVVADRGVVALLEELAAKEGIPHQVKLPVFGATDAGAIQVTAQGARCGVLSVPCRYIHTPLSLLRPSDLEATVRLAVAFVRAAASLL